VSNLCSPDGGEDDGDDALDLHTGGIPKLDGASDIGVKLNEELQSTGHVMGDADVEAPPISLVVAGAVAEEGVCSRLIKVKESRCGRCRW
jgi:MinD superfamily P-loop ATPase